MSNPFHDPTISFRSDIGNNDAITWLPFFASSG
jgi:hypothetical protein